jgi:hypothetical protein
LDIRGVYYDSISDVIDQGKMVCRMLRSGTHSITVHHSLLPYYPWQDATIILASATVFMCPDQLEKVRTEFRDPPA